MTIRLCIKSSEFLTIVKYYLGIAVGCFIIGLVSCSNPKLRNLEKNLKNCPEVELTLQRIYNATISNDFVQRNDLKDSEVDSIFRGTNLGKQCWKELKINKVSYAYNDGKVAGCFANTSDEYIIFFSKSGYWLSPRYKMEKQISSSIYIVSFHG